jgi:hypothetical protein
MKCFFQFAAKCFGFPQDGATINPDNLKKTKTSNMVDFKAARELASLARSHTHSSLTLALDIVTDHFLAVSMQYTPLKSLGKQER